MSGQPSFKRAVLWSYAMNWGGKGFAALFSFFLAAALGPRDFGTLALAMVYIGFVDMILDQGLFSALIQRKDLKREHVDAVFWLNVALSLTLISITFLVSGWWADVNHVPELRPVIRALSSIIIVEALAKVQRAMLQREMDFKSLALRSNGSVVVGGVVGITMALRGYGVWALVAQRITEDVAALVLLWSVGRWRPRFSFSLPHLKELLGFSLATFMCKVGDFAYSQADAAFMGIIFGPVAVGLFRMAQRVVYLVLDSATSSLQIVALSEFSRLQDRPAELRRSVLKCVQLAAIVTFPVLTGVGIASGHLMAVLGDKWKPAAPALSVFCAYGISSALLRFTGPLLLARAKPSLMAVLTWSVNAIGVGAILAAALVSRGASIERQLMVVAWARLLVGAAIAAPIFLFVLLRFSSLSPGELLKALKAPVIASATIGITLAGLNAASVLAGAAPMIRLATEIFIAGGAGIFALMASDKDASATVGRLRSALIRAA